MLNKITRRIPISRYTVPYAVNGTVKTVTIETLSDINRSDLLEVAAAYVNMHESVDANVFFSADYTEDPIGVFTYEMPLTHFIEHAIRRGEKNIPKEE